MRTKALSAGARSLDGARLGGGGGASASFPSADFCPSTARRSNFVCALLTVWLGLLCLEPRWGDFFAANRRIVMEADEEHRPSGTNRRTSTPGEKQWLTI